MEISNAGITKQGIKEVVDAMVRAGFVERIPDPTDGRAHLVRFAPRGKAFEKVMRPLLRELEHEVAGILGEGEHQVLHGLLDQLLASEF